MVSWCFMGGLVDSTSFFGGMVELVDILKFEARWNAQELGCAGGKHTSIHQQFARNESSAMGKC